MEKKAHCHICNVEGETGTCISTPHFIIKIEQIPEEMRENEPPAREMHRYFYGGSGSVAFDGSYYFLKKEQYEKIKADVVCEQCLCDILNGEHLLPYNYGLFGEPGWTEPELITPTATTPTSINH